jgi:hypothetical protein
MEEDMSYLAGLTLEVDDDAFKTMKLLSDIEQQYSCSGGICPA